MTAMSDVVNKPDHYQLFADGTEAIDVIRRTLSPEEFVGYCKGNVLKYRLRAGKKDKLEQDIAKAETYVRMMAAALPHEPVGRTADYPLSTWPYPVDTD